MKIWTKPQVGISSVWFEGNSCNMHLLQLAEKVKEGVRAAGLVGMRFNTIGVSDGIAMGTDGMSFSLQSRDLIADSIETVMSGAMVRREYLDSRLRQEYARVPHRDGATESSFVNGLRRNDPRGYSDGQKLDVISAFQSYGEYLSGRIDEDRRRDRRRHACPGAGACGGMYTANTMASAIEVLGMSLPYSSSTPAEDPLKFEECIRAGCRDPQSSGTRFETARHHDARGIRKCHGAGYGSRRVHQCRPAPDRHGAVCERSPHYRRLSDASATGYRCWPTSNPAVLMSWKTCIRSEACPP